MTGFSEPIDAAVPTKRSRGPGKSLMDWQKKPAGGSRTRFVGTAHHADIVSAALPSDHPAVVEGRPLFPTRVKSATEVPRVLVGGHNNPKIGAAVEKGPWAGFPIFTLTLPERTTCPRSCENWRTCFGNAMPMPRRHAPGPALVAALDRELRRKALDHPTGFAVRLHVLGDFYSVEYAAEWARWMAELPPLHVWGYTARLPDTDIGGLIAEMNRLWPSRWRVRFSVASDAAHAPLQVTTIWRHPDAPRQPEGLMCPQSLERTACCATCGLCWAPSHDAERVVFVGHGMSRRGVSAS